MSEMVRNLTAILLLVAVGLTPAPANAEEDEHQFYTLAGGEFWLGDVTGGHGVLKLHWRWQPSDSPLRLDVDVDTDTLRVRLGQIPLTGDLSLFAETAAEYPYAGLLPDYYRRGERIDARGFRAGYGALTAGVELQSAPHFADVRLTGRRWFFDRSDSTADDLRLPPNTWVGTLGAHYTFWNVETDSSQWQTHQPFMRILGNAFGVSVAADLRSDERGWGRRTGTPDVDARANRPTTPIVTIRQWARAGFRLVGPLRVQLAEQAAWGWGEDDLTRDRIGGLNPYVVPVAGLPWAGLVSGRYAAGRAELRLAGPVDHEIGLFVDAAAVADIRRTGDVDDWTSTGGAGVLADLRHRSWKADVRVGTVLDDDWLLERPALGAWLSVGRRW